jgi:LmbE family N-acetylglucosaminyl deacetylase
VTATFDHLGRGTAESAWAGGPLDAVPELARPTARWRVLVVAAHPDDETLGAGGLIALAGACGADVRVLIVSDGAASHPQSPTHRPGQLAAIRHAEALAAVAALAPAAEVQFLDLADGGLSAATEAIRSAVGVGLDGCTHVVSPWLGDRHPDHQACASAVRCALEERPTIAHWQYPIWAWHWADPTGHDLPWPDLGRLPLSIAARAAKRAGLACYASQHQALSAAPGDEAVLGPDFLAHFDRDAESFILDGSRS